MPAVPASGRWKVLFQKGLQTLVAHVGFLFLAGFVVFSADDYRACGVAAIKAKVVIRVVGIPKNGLGHRIDFCLDGIRGIGCELGLEKRRAKGAAFSLNGHMSGGNESLVRDDPAIGMKFTLLAVDVAP